MDFSAALVLYLILLLVILAFTWKMGIPLFSATVVALLISAIFLSVLVPPTDLDRFTDDMIDGTKYRHHRDSFAVGAFCLIYLITLVVVVWYVLYKAYEDYLRYTCHDF